MLTLVLANFEKLKKACILLQDSLEHLPEPTPECLNNPRTLEPFDALCGRFERAFEVAVNKVFRSIELYDSGTSSSTLRERLLTMEKEQLISSTELWMEMREYRNRIAHDYLPEQLKQLYLAIRDRFSPEIFFCLDQVNLKIKRYLEKEPKDVE